MTILSPLVGSFYVSTSIILRVHALKAHSSDWNLSRCEIKKLYEQKMKERGLPSRNEGLKAVASNIESTYCNILKQELLKYADSFTRTQESRLDMTREEKRRQGLFGSTSRSGGDGVILDEDAEKCIELIEKLTTFMTAIEDEEFTRGWKGSTPSEAGACPLNGDWKLRFTNAADATFRPGKRGRAITRQEVDAFEGTFTNVIDFPDNPGKVILCRI